MENKVGSEEEQKSINGNNLCHLKKEICCHPLYSLLLKTHLDCFKLCLGNVEKKSDDDEEEEEEENFDPTVEMVPGRLMSSELDEFMGAYCMTLKKVKDVIKGPQLESMDFINHMYSQLQDLLLDFPSSSSSPLITPGGEKV